MIINITKAKEGEMIGANTFTFGLTAGRYKGSDDLDAMKAVLGGKGAGLVQMSKAGVPVPPGFVIGTPVCNRYQSKPTGTMKRVVANVEKNMALLAKKLGYAPLVSVRSGARVSMPGMMDTILNVGLCDANLAEWCDRIGERTALDSYRRLVQMLGSVALGVDDAKFEAALAAVREEERVETDAELGVEALKSLVLSFEQIVEEATGYPFPQSPVAQLTLAIEAVFKSWDNDRAKTYRALHGIPDDWGTAVNVQTMVFGNKEGVSGSGVLFTRNPATGENVIMGEFLPNAQGEDVVAGIRTPLPLSDMGDLWPDTLTELIAVVESLEATYRDMQDVEFTVDDGKLYILQTRTGKRTAKAAFQIACDLVDEGVLSWDEAVTRVTYKQYLVAQTVTIDPAYEGSPLATGLPACGGVASGAVVLSPEAAVLHPGSILVTPETNPDDIAGMAVAAGVLTATGGATSHAAVVARAMNKPCITGCTGLTFGEDYVMVDGMVFHEGAMITMDGTTGEVYKGEVPVVDGSNDGAVARIVSHVLGGVDVLFQFDEVTPGATMLMGAEWDMAQMVEVLRGLRGSDRSDIVLDLSPRSAYLSAEDQSLDSVTGVPVVAPYETGPGFKRLVSLLEHLPGMRLRVGDYFTAEQREELVAAGAVIMGYAATLADLLSAKAEVMLRDSFVEDVLGGEEAFAELRDLMQQAGKTVAVLPRDATIEQVVFEQLGSD